MIGVIEYCRVGNGTQQIANQIVEFGVGDQVRGLLVAERSTKDARKSEQRMAAAGWANGLAVVADQLALDAERGRLQRDKIDVLKFCGVQGLAKHDWQNPSPQECR